MGDDRVDKVGVCYEDRQGSHGIAETEAARASVLT